MSWHDAFDALGDHAERRCPAGEHFTLWLQAEDSAFVRFNRGRVRQPGSATQAAITVRWLRGRRHALADVTLTGDAAEDRRRLDEAIDDLRARLPEIAEDPHLLLPERVASSERIAPGSPPDAWAATADILDQVGDLDFVGVWASGTIHRGYRDAAGQRNAFSSHGHVLDACLVQAGDRAVKRTWAGPAWDGAAFAAGLREARRDLAVLARPVRKLPAGTYRAFLTPAALRELLELVGQDGFSARTQRQRRSCLQRLVAGEAALHPSVTLVEDTAGGIAPAFGPSGFTRPDRVVLVEGGRHAGALVSPRSAAEYGLPTNGADDHEAPASLALAAGDLPTADALAVLGTGVWVSDLWYANHSDRNAARVTGMTRFATLWVENGEPVGPVEVMRFDDSLYHLLGSRLVALTREAAFLPGTGSWGWRSTQSMRLPGALVEGLTFTL